MENCIHLLPMNKVSGAEKIVYLLCKNFIKYHAIVICGGEELRDFFRASGIEAYSTDFKGRGILKTFRLIAGIVKKNNVKILHCHDNTASLFGYIIKLRYGLQVNIISHIHSCYPFIGVNSIKKYIDSVFRRKYDLTIFCGSGVMEFYKENCSWFKYIKGTVVSNSVDLRPYTAYDDEIEKTAGSIGVGKDDFVVGYVGRLCSIKGIIPLIKEVNKHRNKFNNMKFLLVGSGEQEEEIKALIKDNKLESLFILTGFQRNVSLYYRLMDVFILPSRYEGLPMVLLEAMAEKVPVISMNVGGIGEILENGRGILVKPGDYEEFTNRICKLYGDEGKRKSMADKGYDYIKSNYSIEKYVQTIERRYEEVQKKGGVYGEVVNNIYTHI